MIKAAPTLIVTGFLWLITYVLYATFLSGYQLAEYPLSTEYQNQDVSHTLGPIRLASNLNPLRFNLRTHYDYESNDSRGPQYSFEMKDSHGVVVFSQRGNGQRSMNAKGNGSNTTSNVSLGTFYIASEGTYFVTYTFKTPDVDKLQAAVLTVRANVMPINPFYIGVGCVLILIGFIGHFIRRFQGESVVTELERSGLHESYIVQQKVEWPEILSLPTIRLETKNRYVICDAKGQALYLAAEESSFFVRYMLRNIRPLSMTILTTQGELLAKLKKPFRFFFNEVQVEDAQARSIGVVRRAFSVLSRDFHVYNAAGTEIYSISSPNLWPWTFWVLEKGNIIGRISKKWSGFGKETFTDTDNFFLSCKVSATQDQKLLLFGALFLLDLLYFEH